MVAPAVITILVVFGGGLFVGVTQSMGYLPRLGMTEITLRHYVDNLTDPRFFTAMALRRSFRGSRVVTFLYQLPLPVPHLVAAAGLVMLLAQSGLVARVLHGVGLVGQPGDFPPIFFDRSSLGIILVYVWKEAPFIGHVLLAVLKGVALDYEDIACTLGAGAWQRFRYVQRFRGRSMVEWLILLPIVVPTLVVAMGIQITLIRVGLADTLPGVVVVHLAPALPYFVLVMTGVFANYSTDLEATARTLGAPPWRIVWHVTLPAILPGLVVTAMFTFLDSWSQYITTVLVGGGRIVTLPMVLFPLIGSANHGAAAAVSIVFVLPALVILV